MLFLSLTYRTPFFGVRFVPLQIAKVNYNIIERIRERSPYVNAGKTIAGLRTGKGLSQQALADLLSVSRDLVSKWENGTRTPDYPTVERIADIFGVSPEIIIDKNDLIFKELAECVDDTDTVPRERLSGIVSAFVRKLSERNAGVFLERYYYLKTTSEISSEYGINENHVRSILSKTRKKLKKHVREGKL